MFDYNHIHFVGIGGISMSALAEILLHEGHVVSGSDLKYSPLIERLRNKGVKVYIGHNECNIEGADLVVYTSAVGDDNPELKEAKAEGIPTLDRASFLGQLMKRYKNSIAVSGTHGKTTTTGMIAVILNNSPLEPTILLGGELDEIDGNVKIGGRDYILTEACEYKGNFLKFFPTVGIILNIEEDHLDYFKDLDHIVHTFDKFGNLIPSDGFLILNNDDKNTRKIVGGKNCNIITFGINNKADYYATNISYNKNGHPIFDLIVKGNKSYKVELNIVGKHNIYNALAAIAATHQLGLPIKDIVKSIKKYKGTHRRFEIKGTFNQVQIIDDYAHHPTEIKATLNTASNLSHNRIWCVFQPHTYTRTKALLNEFAQSFDKADKIIITDIYAAREKDRGIVHSKDLVEALKKRGKDAIYIDNFHEIADHLKKNITKDDIVLTVGAGNVFEIGELILEKKCV
ncbi:UDP-N-acetylmuramate--L-alanine ligase [Thermohalobacter berrensis]|uniref:UDP-N-acetylmuramate--L-alanine ligase n=1 Tax=Thermohalobacter berrensis TaxID=99594 RepID=A0A419T8W0_9FIRM|nr:UDP-N-acetylmuramate--L-alanine ligase [Thermohalobacter berrensis]RKD33903.1 UDP-N-acetylmuramate--L-alanine ligase [Thermohalobacter berrensis]